jgi:hypothetical protein
MYQEQSSSPLGHGRHLLIQCIVDAIRNSLRIRMRPRCMAPGGISVAEWPIIVSPEREEISTKFQRLSHIFDHAHFKGVTPTMPDVSRLLKINMATIKPEVDCISGTLSTDPICYLNRQQIKSVGLLQNVLFKFTNYSVNIRLTEHTL